MLVDLRSSPLQVAEALAHLDRPETGAVDLFVGRVRNHNQGQRVTALEYQAYRPMALAELERLAREVEASHPVQVVALHRVGLLHVGDLAVLCAASAAHRAEAFAACRALIEGIKSRVPLWKREHRPSGPVWLDGCGEHP